MVAETEQRLALFFGTGQLPLSPFNEVLFNADGIRENPHLFDSQ